MPAFLVALVLTVPSSENAPTPVADPVPEVRALLELAIERGAPLYNHGQVAACAAIYEVTARSIVALGGEKVGSEGVDRLQAELERLDRHPTPAARAWALRHALDEVWSSLVRTTSSAEQAGWSHPSQANHEYRHLAEQEQTMKTSHSSETRPGERQLFGFVDRDREPRWFTLNDDVMGGVSQSEFAVTERGTALFRGALSLRNNGGFATIRSRAADLDLAGASGLILRVRGDGRTYSIGAMPSSARGQPIRFC